MGRPGVVKVAFAVPALVAALAVGAAACGAGRSSAPPRQTTPRETAPSTPTLAVVLGDHGLSFSPHRIRAGRYLVSFGDRRSRRPPGQHLALQFAPSGPLFVLLDVPAGTERTGTLLANEIAWAAIDGVRHPFPGDEQLAIDVSPRFPTPAT